MRRHLAILGICVAPAMVFAQETTSQLYERLESLYIEVIEVYLGGGDLCLGRSRAVEQKQTELANALSRATATTGDRVLLFAVTANSLSHVRRLNEAGASRGGDHGSLLHVAARFADPPLLEYLVKAGFDLEETAGAGGPALLVAVAGNRLNNVAWLIEHGANVNAADDAGGIVLRHALACQDQKLVDYLFDAGAIPDDKTYEVARKLGISLQKR